MSRLRPLGLAAALVLVAGEVWPQSLGELARRESERRKGLDQRGVPEKVIAEEQLARGIARGNVSTSKPGHVRHPRAITEGTSKKASPSPYRTRLRKLDREIRGMEERLALLRRRAQSQRWAPPSGRGSRGTSGSGSWERTRQQIEELELRLSGLRAERLETYDEGRKAGFLPGELDGKGIIP